MKRLKLFFSDIKDTWFSHIIVLIIMIASVFSFARAYGRYRYISDPYHLLESAGIENSLYFEEKNLEYMGENYTSEITELTRKIEQFPAVEYASGIDSVTILCQNGGFSLSIFDEGIKGLYPKTLQGEWFTDAVNEDGSINAVMTDEYISGVEVGDVLEVYLAGNNDVSITIKITGILPYYSQLPSLSAQASEMLTEYLYNAKGALLVQNNPIIEDLKKTYSQSFSNDGNFIVIFRDGASQSDIDECKTFLGSNGGYHEMSNILQQSKENMDLALKKNMISPLFYLFIAFMAFISITALTIYKKMDHQAVYLLIGCSKRRMLTDVLTQMGIICLIAGALNIYLTSNYGLLTKLKLLQSGFVIFDKKIIIVIVSIILVMFIFIMLTAVLLTKRKSPVELLRKFEN